MKTISFPSLPYSDYNHPVIKNVDDYERIPSIDPLKTPRMSEFVRLCRIMVKEVGLKSIICGFTFSPLGVLSMMRGAERLFKDCVLYPEKVKKACEIITGVLIEYVCAQCDTGVSAVAIDTLFASKSGLPEKLWEEIEGPFAGEISRAVKDRGLIVGVHNCGNDLYFDSQIRSMEPDVISFAHLPDDCKDRKELKKKYGDQVVLMGYVPTPLLVHGTPAEVMDECRRQIDDLAPGGGLILAPGCEYPPNIPLTNCCNDLSFSDLKKGKQQIVIGYSPETISRQIHSRIIDIIDKGLTVIQPVFIIRTTPITGWGNGRIDAKGAAIDSKKWAKLLKKMKLPEFLCCFIITLGKRIDVIKE
ncbi:MAG: uroporphyrinogen decarboxylase family protein [Dissulfuribacterales bacterium]